MSYIILSSSDINSTTGVAEYNRGLVETILDIGNEVSYVNAFNDKSNKTFLDESYLKKIKTNIALNLSMSFNPIKFLFSRRKAKKAIKKLAKKGDSIIISGYFWVAFIPKSWFTKYKISIIQHSACEWIHQYFTAGLKRFYMKRKISVINKFIFYNDLYSGKLTQLLGLREEQTLICKPPLDLKTNNSIDRENNVLYMCGIQECKNPYLLIEIAKSLPNYNFTVGGWIDEQNLPDVKGILETTPNIKYIGEYNKEDFNSYVSNNKYFLVTSKPFEEGFGLASLEALCLGCTVITSEQMSNKTMQCNNLKVVKNYEAKEFANLIKDHKWCTTDVDFITSWTNAKEDLKHAITNNVL